jgi:hypothetical protein
MEFSFSFMVDVNYECVRILKEAAVPFSSNFVSAKEQSFEYRNPV